MPAVITVADSSGGAPSIVFETQEDAEAIGSEQGAAREDRDGGAAGVVAGVTVGPKEKLGKGGEGNDVGEKKTEKVNEQGEKSKEGEEKNTETEDKEKEGEEEVKAKPVNDSDWRSHTETSNQSIHKYVITYTERASSTIAFLRNVMAPVCGPTGRPPPYLLARVTVYTLSCIAYIAGDIWDEFDEANAFLLQRRPLVLVCVQFTLAALALADTVLRLITTHAPSILRRAGIVCLCRECVCVCVCVCVCAGRDCF